MIPNWGWASKSVPDTDFSANLFGSFWSTSKNKLCCLILKKVFGHSIEIYLPTKTNRNTNSRIRSASLNSGLVLLII